MTTTLRPTVAALSAIALAAAVGAPPARAAHAYDSCTAMIERLPAVITSQGTWCMNKDLATSMQSGSAISVQANNVTIDCNGFKLGGLGAGSGTGAFGVFANGRGNVTVRNCAIRGFQYGINLFGGIGGHVVEDNRIEASTIGGISIQGDNVRIRRNHVIDTGGTTLYPDAAGMGISLDGSGAIEDNRVSGVRNGSGQLGDAWGIFASLQDSTVSRNQISGLASNYTNRPLDLYGSVRVVVRDNEITDSPRPQYAIRCIYPGVTLRGNTVGGYAYFSTEHCNLGPDNHHF